MSLSALNETGQAVDWWFMYKVPKLGKDANSQSAGGYESLSKTDLIAPPPGYSVADAKALIAATQT